MTQSADVGLGLYKLKKKEKTYLWKQLINGSTKLLSTASNKEAKLVKNTEKFECSTQIKLGSTLNSCKLSHGDRKKLK